jgi:hypothetical protein
MATADDTPPRDVWAQLCWAGLFGANAVVAGWAGLVVTERGGRAGLVAGVGVLFAVWQLGVQRSAALRAALVPGCLVLAVTQFVPFLQYFAGLVGIKLVRPGDVLVGGPLTDAEACLATVLTGAMLWAAAWAAGATLRTLGGLLVGRIR